ncbi:MAG TPA: response regulator [Anaerolineales bacterium]
MENGQNLPAVDSHVKIVIVDDHPNTANMLARAISRLGSHVEVFSATSGLEALQHIEDGAADILITDLMMPEMTGMELIEALNDQPSIAPAVSFLLTAHDSAGVREIAQRLNVKEVISKPVHPEWICQLISQTIFELKQSKPVNSEPDSQGTGHMDLGTESNPEDLHVSKLLWEVAKKFQSQADIKNQLLAVGKTESDSIVRGSAVQLRQALRNLVWSAIQNTPKGGTVILSSENKGDVVKIFIRDTGYGVPSANLPELLHDSEFIETIGFEDDNEIDQNMAVVKTIAKQHSGIVTVESEVGKGTCFTLSLPLYQNERIHSS